MAMKHNIFSPLLFNFFVSWFINIRFVLQRRKGQQTTNEHRFCTISILCFLLSLSFGWEYISNSSRFVKKYSAARDVFNSLYSVKKTMYFAFDILHHDFIFEYNEWMNDLLGCNKNCQQRKRIKKPSCLNRAGAKPKSKPFSIRHPPAIRFLVLFRLVEASTLMNRTFFLEVRHHAQIWWWRTQPVPWLVDLAILCAFLHLRFFDAKKDEYQKIYTKCKKEEPLAPKINETKNYENSNLAPKINKHNKNYASTHENH